MSEERKITHQELCWSGSALQDGNFVRFEDGGSKNRAVLCDETEAEGVCRSTVEKSWVLIEVDVFEPWVYTAAVATEDDWTAVVISRAPGNTVIAVHRFLSDTLETERLLVSLLVQHYKAKTVLMEGE